MTDRTDGEGKPPKRRYTMSDKALEQRRSASPSGVESAKGAATGPRTPEGKARSSRNAWKHGLRSRGADALRDAGIVWQAAKPCRTTCTRYPCGLVTDGITAPGGDCLDKTVYLEAFDAVIESMRTGRIDAMHAHLAMHAAGALEMLQDLRAEIAARGFLLTQDMVDKEGNVTGQRYYPNPVLPHYIALLDKLGINLAELMTTPRAISRVEREEEQQESIASVIGNALARLAPAGKRRPPVTIDQGSDADGE